MRMSGVADRARVASENATTSCWPLPKVWRVPHQAGYLGSLHEAGTLLHEAGTLTRSKDEEEAGINKPKSICQRHQGRHLIEAGMVRVKTFVSGTHILCRLHMRKGA